MSRRVDTVNRVVLAVLGLLLLAAGGLGLALSVGAFGAWRATYPVLPHEVSVYPLGRPWFWWTVAAALLVIAVLALWWLLSQLRSDRPSRLDLTTDAPDGYTSLRAGGLTGAVEDEALTVPGVTRVAANVLQHHGRHLFMRVELADSADIAGVRTQLENQVVGHARESVGDPGLPVTIELRPGAGTGARRAVA